MDEFKMLEVIELPTFVSDCEKVMAHAERHEFIAHISGHPEAGDVVQNTGGIRKVRWAVENKGKSGGVRVLYYYLDVDTPIYLLMAYKKGRKDTLSATDKQLLKDLAKIMKQTHKGE